MSTPSLVAELLANALQAAPELGTAYEAQSPCWVIECPCGASLWVQWIEASSVLALSTSLGHPDPAHETAALSLALASNQHWHGQTRLHFARDGTDGELLLLSQLPLAGLSPHELANGLKQLEAMRALWALALPGIGQVSPPTATDLLPGLLA